MDRYGGMDRYGYGLSSGIILIIGREVWSMDRYGGMDRYGYGLSLGIILIVGRES